MSTTPQFGPAGGPGRTIKAALLFRARPPEINLDRSHLRRQFSLLPLERLHQLLLPPLALFPAQLLRRDRLAAAALRMGVVRRPARTLLRVLLLPPLGPAVLEPHLKAAARGLRFNNPRM